MRIKYYLSLATILYFSILCSSCGESSSEKKELFTFLDKTYEVPKGCSVVAPTIMHCDSFSITSTAVAKEDIQRHINEEIEETDTPLEIQCRILGQPTAARKIGMIDSNVLISACGVINGQPALISFFFKKRDVKSNEDIPTFLRQILVLDKPIPAISKYRHLDESEGEERRQD